MSLQWEPCRYFWTSKISMQVRSWIFFGQKFSNSKFVSIMTLMDEIQPVTLEQKKFEWRDLSESVAFWQTWTIWFPMKRAKSSLDIKYSTKNKKNWFMTLKTEIDPVFMENYDLIYRKGVKWRSSSWKLWNYHNQYERSKLNDFWNSKILWD